jgi:cation diffusion facilitator family transporter
MNPRDDDRLIQRVALYAILVNVALAVLRGWLAQLSGSLAVLAITIDAAVDVIAALLLWGGLKLSARKSRTFPYGLYKLENVIQVVVALLIFVVAAEIVHQAVTGSGSLATASPLVIAGLAFSTVAVLALGLYMAHEGKKSASPGLLAEARHRRVDVVASAVVFVALLSGYLGLPVDRPAAGLVAAFIIYSGWGLLWEGMKVLLDASLDQETLMQARQIAETDPAVIEVRSLVGRNSGRYRFLEIVLVVRAGSLEKAHAVSTRIEKRIREELGRIDRVSIHCEPQVRTHLRVAVPLADLEGTVSSHFGEAPFFARLLVRADNGEVEEQRITSNLLNQTERGRGILVAEWLVRDKIDLLIQKEQLGKGPEYAFRDAGVEVEVWDITKLAEAIDRVRQEISRLV